MQNCLKFKNIRGIIVTAKGEEVDFVSRFFAPQSGIPEDPVTGSAHTTLTPYWSGKLGKDKLSAIQLSPRKGYLTCENLGERIKISGRAKTFSAGNMYSDRDEIYSNKVYNNRCRHLVAGIYCYI